MSVKLPKGYAFKMYERDFIGRSFRYCVYPVNGVGAANFFKTRAALDRWTARVNEKRKWEAESSSV